MMTHLVLRVRESETAGPIFKKRHDHPLGGSSIHIVYKMYHTLSTAQAQVLTALPVDRQANVHEFHLSLDDQTQLF